MIDSKHMRDMTKAPGAIRKRRTHTHVCCSTLQISYWYKALASKGNEKRSQKERRFQGARAEEREYRSAVGIQDTGLCTELYSRSWELSKKNGHKAYSIHVCEKDIYSPFGGPDRRIESFLDTQTMRGTGRPLRTTRAAETG